MAQSSKLAGYTGAGIGLAVLLALAPGMQAAYAAMLETVAALVWDPLSDEFTAFAKKGWKDADPSRDELIDEVCYAVQDLRLYWLDQASRTLPRRVEATPGRNDPCPCGSGKKYKKCHGA